MGKADTFKLNISNRIRFLSDYFKKLIQSGDLYKRIPDIQIRRGINIQDRFPGIVIPLSGRIKFFTYIFDHSIILVHSGRTVVLMPTRKYRCSFFGYIINHIMKSAPFSAMHSMNYRAFRLLPCFNTFWSNGIGSMTLPMPTLFIIIWVTR